MKKKLLLFVLFSIVSITIFAQSKNKTMIAFEGGAPAGATGRTVSFIVGGSINHDVPVSQNVSFSFSGGYSSMLGQTGNPAHGYIPVKVGGKCFFTPVFFGEAQIGAVMSTSKGTNVGVATATGIGAHVTENIEFGVRYESWSRSATTMQQVGFKLGYRF